MTKNFKRLHVMMALVASLTLVVSAQADDPDKMPAAETVMKKFADALGGADKLKAIKTMRTKGKFALPSMGMEGQLELTQMMPGKVFTKVIIPGAGTQSVATNGDIAWELSTMTGPRLLQGKEIDQIREEGSMEKFYDPMSFYKEVKVVGMEDVEGDKCYKVKVTKKNGDVAHDYFSMKTGLQMKSETTVVNQMGEIKAETLISGYKEFGGLKFPTKSVIKLEGLGERVMTFDKIEINPEIDEKTFAIPEEVQNLIDSGVGDEDGEEEKGSYKKGSDKK